MENEQQVIDSRELAQIIEKDHRELLRNIRDYIAYWPEYSNGGKFPPVDFNGWGSSPVLEPTDFFIRSSYIDKKHQLRPCYLVTEKGCHFIANKLTGEKGAAFTAAYVNRFHAMREQLALPGGGQVAKPSAPEPLGRGNVPVSGSSLMAEKYRHIAVKDYKPAKETVMVVSLDLLKHWTPPKEVFADALAQAKRQGFEAGAEVAARAVAQDEAYQAECRRRLFDYTEKPQAE